MAARRDWQRLGPTQRKRYLGAGRKQGLTEAQVIQHYESGGSLKAWRGQGPAARAGISERQWRLLTAAAKISGLDPRTEVLESLLAKGFSVDWILSRLANQASSRAIYRAARPLRRAGNPNAGREPGRSRFRRRNMTADIELYYYH